MSLRLSLPIIVACALLAGCGGNGGDSAGVTTACPAAPAELGSPPDLPQGYPSPPEVTYVEDLQAGPARIVRGYWRGDIDAAFEGYKDAFEASSFEVTKEEKESVDAEVNFAGGGVSGQVKLLQTCRDRTDVSITVRPE
jgi:hypothetical protein